MHAAAARSNTGELVSSALERARKYPPLAMTPLLPAAFDGGEVLGSGKSGTPCSRMHADRLSIPARALGERGSRLDPAGLDI